MAIRDQAELLRAISLDVTAQRRIQQAELERDEAKQEADKTFERAAGKYRDRIEELHLQIEDFCRDHCDEIFPDGKKSAILGEGTVQFRKTPEKLLTTSGAEPNLDSVIEAIEDQATTARGNCREQLLACVQIKKVLKNVEVRKLPEDILKAMGLRLEASEVFVLKPNAER